MDSARIQNPSLGLLAEKPANWRKKKRSQKALECESYVNVVTAERRAQKGKHARRKGIPPERSVLGRCSIGRQDAGQE